MSARLSPVSPAAPPVFYVCGDTVRSSARSGIQTVVRSLAAAFGQAGTPVRPVVWRPGPQELCPLPAARSLGLGAEPLRDPPLPRRAFLRYPGSWVSLLLAGGNPDFVSLQRHPRHSPAPPGTWILMPELLYGGKRATQFVDYVHRHGWRLAVVLYDLIPVRHPEFVPPQLPSDHAEYLRAFSRADLILPISEATAEDWREFVAREKLPTPPVHVCTLACDLPGTRRVRNLFVPDADADTARMLCVSTLEPRKNHLALFAAYELAAASRPDLALHLDLAGAPYVGAHPLGEAARDLVARHPGRVRWHERVEHAAIRQLYAACDFTVYPSVLEGFGLPIIESLWFGRPCLCADFGVMAENATAGGCLTADVRDPAKLADAILQLATSPDLRRKLSLEATIRHLKTWREYADELLDSLRSQK